MSSAQNKKEISMDLSIQPEDEDEVSPSTKDPTEFALAIPLILKSLLKDLSIPDLLNCSLVNKQWNHTARKILFENRETVASVRSISKSCVNLIPNILTYTRFSAPFINTIEINPAKEFCKAGACHHLAMKPNLIKAFPNTDLRIKYLIVRKGFEVCQRIFFLLNEICGSASLAMIHVDKIRFLHHPLQGFQLMSMESVKVLRTNLPLQVEYGHRDFYKFVTTLFPNLEFLDWYVEPWEVVLLLEDQKTARCIKKLRFNPDQNFELYQLFTTAEGPKLVEITATMNTRFGSFDRIPRCWELLRAIWTNSAETLKSVQICAAVAVKIMAMGFPQLPNVARVELCLICAFENSESLIALGRFDFSHFFPNASTVSVDWSTAGFNSHMVQFETVEKPNQSLTAKVKCLELSGSAFTVINFSAFLFSNIETLEIKNVHVTILPAIFNAWPKIKRIKIAPVANLTYSSVGVLEASFCGISVEEMIELMELDPALLDKLTVVPQNYSMLQLTELRELEIHGVPRYSMIGIADRLVFKRLPNLKVIIKYFSD